ncbi:hypothetical protein H4R35_006702, partial [Dimargaris xerosporica]
SVLASPAPLKQVVDSSDFAQASDRSSARELAYAHSDEYVYAGSLYQDEDAQFIDELINEINKYGVLHLATALVNYGELLVTSGLIDEEYLAVVARFNILKSEFNTDNYADQLRILFERVKVLALDPGTADARIRGYFNTIHDKLAALMAQQ